MRTIHASRLAPALLAVPIAAALGGCTESTQRPAIGSYSDVAAVTGGDDWVLDSLQSALESRIRPLSQDESPFHVRRLPESRLADSEDARNLLLATLLDASGPVAKQVRRIMPGEDQARIRSRGAGWFLYPDVYARGQVVVVLAAVRRGALDSLLAIVGADLRDALERSAIERTTRDLRRASAASPEAEHFAARYGFEILVPSTYRVAAPSKGWLDAVELVRDSPSRIVSVFWTDPVDSLQATDEKFVLGLQRDVMRRLHGDTLVEDRNVFERSSLGPYTALQLTGVWQNTSQVAGGPFVTHFVYDGRRRRLYGVQGLLFAPGRDKHPWMRELRALAATFRLGEST
ncbi:MAG: DUF4837 family protein [Candidatus Krumholzibacteriia bacterium]